MEESVYKWYKAHKICPRCKKKSPENGFVTCSECREQIRKYYNKERKQGYNENVSERVSKGLCRWCGEPVSETDKRHCEKHRLRMCELKKKWRAKQNENLRHRISDASY